MFGLPFWMFPSFFLIAFVYALVGFGGGSSYLALLSFSTIPLKQISAIALFCNLIVAGSGAWNFFQAGQLRLQLLWPFLLGSVPAAYFGASIKTEDSMQRFVLGICLLFVALRFWIGVEEKEAKTRCSSRFIFYLAGLLIGAGLGFLSGYVGIGGGIFLSPLLILTGLATTKQASAGASLFILLNSISGLIPRLDFLKLHFFEYLLLGMVVLVGGQLGSLTGLHYLNSATLRKILAAFISYASLRLLWMAL